MPPEASGLAAAAGRKREHTLARATAALSELDARGERIDFQAVARAAGVSRQWLYKQPQLRAEIERLRAIRPHVGDAPMPARERSTDASLHQRIRTLREENQRLREENANLTDELALAYGHQRELSLLGATRSAGGLASHE